MISMTLAEFTATVRKVESEPPPKECSTECKKSNGMSAELEQYLDSLSTPSVLESEVERLSAEITQLQKDCH